LGKLTNGYLPAGTTIAFAGLVVSKSGKNRSINGQIDHAAFMARIIISTSSGEAHDDVCRLVMENQ
jgi:hypothetical protein